MCKMLIFYIDKIFFSQYEHVSLHFVTQAKEEYQKVMIQLMEERQQHEATIAEYKQVCQH